MEEIDNQHLHSNMVLFKSNGGILNSPTILFTFQYGSIQIYTTNVIKVYVEEFTFQYGSIQIRS